MPVSRMDNLIYLPGGLNLLCDDGACRSFLTEYGKFNEIWCFRVNRRLLIPANGCNNTVTLSTSVLLIISCRSLEESAAAYSLSMSYLRIEHSLTEYTEAFILLPIF